MSPDDDADATIDIDERSTPVQITLAGAVGAYHSDDMYATCLTALERGAPVVVSCGEATHVGASIVQLMLALRGALAERGHGLALRDVPPALAALLSLAGLTT
ncbi:MAG TPA: STAS domain-containing protein [Kofleriaceae bacterium]|nr:STAS domain-containing protein [Kofleriaceae bacterium]